MSEGWGSRASILYATYDLFPTELSEEMFLKVCCISNPLCAPAAATYENQHGFKPRRQGIPANFWEAVYKEIVTDSAMTAEEKARRYADMPEWTGRKTGDIRLAELRRGAQ